MSSRIAFLSVLAGVIVSLGAGSVAEPEAARRRGPGPKERPPAFEKGERNVPQLRRMLRRALRQYGEAYKRGDKGKAKAIAKRLERAVGKVSAKSGDRRVVRRKRQLNQDEVKRQQNRRKNSPRLRNERKQRVNPRGLRDQRKTPGRMGPKGRSVRRPDFPRSRRDWGRRAKMQREWPGRYRCRRMECPRQAGPVMRRMAPRRSFAAGMDRGDRGRAMRRPERGWNRPDRPAMRRERDVRTWRRGPARRSNYSGRPVW